MDVLGGLVGGAQLITEGQDGASVGAGRVFILSVLARWMEVIKRATSSPARSSLQLPKGDKDTHSD